MYSGRRGTGKGAEEKQSSAPPLFFPAAAFPTLATMSCATLLPLHTNKGKKMQQREGQRETHTLSPGCTKLAKKLAEMWLLNL